MQDSWIVLLPPLIVLASAFISRNVIMSLAAGIMTAALISTDLSPISSFTLATRAITDILFNVDNLLLFVFLFIVGMIVSLIGITGGAHAFGEKLTKKIGSTYGVQRAALVLPFLVSIDDYLNCLTVGHVMHPLTDKFRIPRAKLAYFIDSMTAPLAIITPISSWAGTIISQFELSGITLNPSDNPVILIDSFSAYLKVIPFTFYSFIIMLSAWFIVLRKISFGSMHTHEQIALETGNVFGGRMPTKEISRPKQIEKASIWDLLFPIALLVGLVLMLALYLGNYWLFGGNNSLIDAFQTKYNIFLVLFLASAISFLASIIFGICREKIHFQDIPKVIYRGFKLMWLAVLTVLLAWSFSFLLREHLHTGNYLAALLIGKFSISMLPLMLFITTCFISVLTGSAWGAMAIMVPIATPIVLTFLKVQIPVTADQVEFMFPCLGAVLSGAATGDHLSPISDTTIMSSTSSGAYHVDHVKTQLEYTWPALTGTGLAFLISGLIAPTRPLLAFIIPFLGGLSLSFGILTLLNRYGKRAPKKKI